MLKKLPELQSDREAEDFVATADLASYDLSGFAPARFRFVGETVNAVELPQELLQRVEREAERSGTSRDDFIRSAVERALRGAAA